jgi:hypothetical protein
MYNCNSDGTQGSLVYSSSSAITHANTGVKWGDFNPGAGLLVGNLYYAYFGAYQNGNLSLSRYPNLLHLQSYLAISGRTPIPDIATTPAYISDGFQAAYGYANDTYYPGGYAYCVYAANSDGSKGALISTVNASHGFDPTFKFLGNVGLHWNTWYYINVGFYQNGTLIPGQMTYNVQTAPCSGVISTNLTHTNTTCQLANGTATSAPTGGNSPYTYSWSTTPTCTTSSASNIYAGTYTVTVTDSKNCTATSTVTLTNTGTSPTVTVNSPTVAICNGTSTTLTLTGSGTSYTWAPSSGLSTTTGTNVVASPTATTIYTITATLGSCIAQAATSSVTVNPTPTLTVNSPTVAICNGNSTTLTVTGSGTTFSWTPSTGLSATTGTNVVASPTTTIVYTVTATLGSCTAQTTSTITVNPTPTLTVNSPTVAICNGNSTTLTTTGNGTTYSWTPSTGLSATTGTNVVASPTATTIYTVTATFGSCTGIATSTVTVNSLPTLTVTLSSNAICIGGTSTFTATGASTYTWSPGSSLNTTSGTPVTATPTTTTTYSISGIDANSCVNTTTFVVTVNPLPTINVAANPRPAIYSTGGSVTVTASGASTYTWSPPNGLNTTTSATVIASPTVTTIYTVTATDANTCVNTQTINILYSPLSIAYQTQNILPNQLQNSGYIITNALNGFPPYHYLWSDNASTQNNRYNLTAGSYALTIVDSLQDTLRQNFTIGSNLVTLISENISDSGGVYKNTAYPSGSGAITFANTLNANTDGWLQFSIQDTASNAFIGFQQNATDSSTQSISGPSIQTSTKYIARSVFNGNPQLLASYDTLASSYSDSVKVNAKKLLNTNGNTPVTSLSAISISHNKLLVFISGTTNQKAISINPGDVFRIGRSGGLIYVHRNGQSMTLPGSNITAAVSPQLYVMGNQFSPSGFTVSSIPFPGHGTMFNCWSEIFINSVTNNTFDEQGSVISQTKTYYDNLGRTTQSQARLLSQNNTLVTQNLFDGLGRAVGQTLPAPDFQSYLCYQPTFVTSSLSGHSNQNYSYVDFDMPNTTANSAGQTNNPSPVANSTQGSLGWYYSNNNTAEPFVAASGLPYNRVEYYPDPTGQAKKVAGVGEDHAMGSGHESSVYYMVNGGELDFFYGYHNSYQVNPDMSAQTEPNENLDVYKTVTVNADGKEDISYVNSSGQVIASCVSGGPDACVPITVVQGVKFMGTTSRPGNGSSVIHLPKSQNASLSFPIMTVTNPGASYCNRIKNAMYFPTGYYGLVTYNLVDITTDKLLIQGTDYTIDATTRKVTFINGYQNKSLYLRISYNYSCPAPPSSLSCLSASVLPDIAVQYQLDYNNWTLNFFDTKGHLITNVAPNDVNCQNQGQLVPVTATTYTNIQTPALPGSVDYYTGANPDNNFSWQNGACGYTYCTSSPQPVYTFSMPSGLQNNATANLEFNFVSVHGNSIANQRQTNTQNSYSRSISATIATPGLADTSVTSIDTAALRQVALYPQFFVENEVIDTINRLNPTLIVTDSLGNNIDTVSYSDINERFVSNNSSPIITYSVNYNVVYKYANLTTKIVSDQNGPINYPLEFQVVPVSPNLSGPNGITIGGGPLLNYNNPSVSVSASDMVGLRYIEIVPASAYVSVTGYPGITSGQWFNLCTNPGGASTSHNPVVNAFGATNMSSDDWAFIEFAFLQYAGLQTTVTIGDYTYYTNQHTFSKQFTYDNYNRLSSSKSVDEGEKDFVYDSEDKLHFSQNDEQRTVSNGGRFTYINYDRAARPIETGEYDPNISNSASPYYFQTEANAGATVPSGATSIYNVINQVGSFDTYRTTQQTYSAYDLPDATLGTTISNYSPTFLPCKVAKTWNAYSPKTLGTCICLI